MRLRIANVDDHLPQWIVRTRRNENGVSRRAAIRNSARRSQPARGQHFGQPIEFALHIIPQAKAQQRLRIQSLEEQMAAQAAYQMLGGDFAMLAGPSWNNDERQLADARQRLYRLEMEPYRRWANGFSCLCFVLVGAPLAIVMRNSDFLTSFFMCFLPILIFYYPLMAFGVSQAKSGSFPSCGVWAGNLILAIIGTYCIRRVCRY